MIQIAIPRRHQQQLISEHTRRKHKLRGDEKALKEELENSPTLVKKKGADVVLETASILLETPNVSSSSKPRRAKWDRTAATLVPVGGIIGRRKRAPDRRKKRNEVRVSSLTEAASTGKECCKRISMAYSRRCHEADGRREATVHGAATFDGAPRG